MVITSYALARRDRKLLTALDWHRVVLDEAQNIKNPKAAQTKAVLALKAGHRLALTGTPVENRLTDLWSIFNFINPGYLGTQTRFRNQFELPVQRDNDPAQTATLKRLVEPFILRRVKTDRTIIADLPDKVEAIQYCNLSREQAALYETVVRDVERQLEEKEGIERQGLVLSTLMRLKQICNHPAQFLQDGSDFTAERSHKLERLREMLEEVMAEGDSVLIFSQFTEIGDRLEHFLKQQLHCTTHYLHGGTPRGRREAMIEAFQDPRTEPSVFILSLKAGGVGITLTKANHVFHFDRWWNPAVEDQASDRAFRIGQEKNVFVHKFVTLGTLEERINDMIEEKRPWPAPSSATTNPGSPGSTTNASRPSSGSTGKRWWTDGGTRQNLVGPALHRRAGELYRRSPPATRLRLPRRQPHPRFCHRRRPGDRRGTRQRQPLLRGLRGTPLPGRAPNGPHPPTGLGADHRPAGEQRRPHLQAPDARDARQHRRRLRRNGLPPAAPQPP